MTVPLHWLTRHRDQGVTWGMPWPRGQVPDVAALALAGAPGAVLQSWALARWPDGSVKWSGHAVPALPPDAAPAMVVRPVPTAEAGVAEAEMDGPEVSVVERADGVLVDTGAATWLVPRSGDLLVARGTVRVDGAERVVLDGARLVSLHQDGPDTDDSRPARARRTGVVEEVVVEQRGPVRAVVRVSGRHRAGSAAWLPFTVRLVAYAGSTDLRVQHAVVWDGDMSQDFLAGLGLEARVPLPDEPHDRHVRIAGPQQPDGFSGFLTEAVRGLTGLRRDPGERFRAAQVDGRPAGPVEEWAPAVRDRAHWVPCWNDWTLDQLSPDGFTLRKRTAPGQSWVTIPGADRSAGYAYLGGAGGGVGLGLRDFWQQHPVRLDVRDAASGTGTVTCWLWSPTAPAMDLRPYHDGLGQHTYADQLDALEITYEDHEDGFAEPHGIARTHELVLRAYGATPSGSVLSEHVAALHDPALLQAAPEHLHAAGVLGSWSLPDRSVPEAAEVEDRLDFLAAYFAGQREQRRWYGFWDYGDVMHAYDADRHQWRYDVGGYAWDNSELSPDLWLWYAYLRSGRADLFRLAEAMTRHTGEVDVYHQGPWAGLGSRHNVQHWGCSAKQLRISNAAYRRFLHYLTADERAGELLDELATCEQALLQVDATRKVRTDVYAPDPSALAVGLGTDWGALAAAWLTRWERHGDTVARDKLLATMRGIAALPQGFLTGEALMDLATGELDTTRDRVMVSHLSAVFGLVEICDELITLTEGSPHEVPGFADAWLRYCLLYGATPDEQAAAVGAPLRGISLVQAHSRLTAWAAARVRGTDPALADRLADRAWRAFRQDEGDQLNVNALQREAEWRVTRVDGPTVLAPVDEAAYVSTNDAAQYGLAAIQLLELLGAPPSAGVTGGA
ncbi:Tat pathway signal sequence domain protein [Antribacter gilvus]|uniref:exo-rhamnogalacturonan lyase family protein n=1 Tax=Antribacter gilvus TaxID=2304675 RepID=UPI000F79D20E|nr:Tat pathway signal sequence domain protein [Antribacter gilvus]